MCAISIRKPAKSVSTKIVLAGGYCPPHGRPTWPQRCKEMLLACFSLWLQLGVHMPNMGFWYSSWWYCFRPFVGIVQSIIHRPLIKGDPHICRKRSYLCRKYELHLRTMTGWYWRTLILGGHSTPAPLCGMKNICSLVHPCT